MAVQEKFDFTKLVTEPTTLTAVWDCSPGFGTIYYKDTDGSEKTYELINQDDFDVLYGKGSNDTSTTKVLNFYGISLKRGQITRIDIGSKITEIKNYFGMALSKCVEVNNGINVERIGLNFLFRCVALTSITNMFPATLIHFEAGFMSSCESFNQPIDHWPLNPKWDKKIGATFLVNCKKFNSTLPQTWENTEQIGDGFLSGCSSFNQPIPAEFPASVTDLNGFLYNCSKFNQPIPQVIPPKVTTLIQWAYGLKSFTHQLPPIPATVKTLGYMCFTNLWSYDKDIIIPATITSVTLYGTTSVGRDSFQNTQETPTGKGYTGTIYWETSALPTSTNAGVVKVFMANATAAPLTYTQGLKISGAHADDLLARLPNSDVAPFRKLIKA